MCRLDTANPQKVPPVAGFLSVLHKVFTTVFFLLHDGGPVCHWMSGFLKVISFLRKLQTSFIFIYVFPHRSGNTRHFSQKVGSFASWRFLKLGDSFWICGNEDGWFFELCSNKNLQLPPRISYKRVGLRFPYIGSLDPGTDGRFLSQWLSPKFDGLRLCCL